MTEERQCGAPDLYRLKRRSRTGLPSGRHTIVMRNMSLVASNITCIAKPKWIRSLEGMLPDTWNKAGRLQGGLPQTREKRFLKDPLILCRGLARRVGLRVSGRRNALGGILGRRTGAWQSGTHPAFATVFRSNTHTMPNYRVPILQDSRRPGMPAQRSVRVQWRQSHGNQVVEDHVQARPKGAARGGRLLLWLHVQSTTSWEKAS